MVLGAFVRYSCKCVLKLRLWEEVARFAYRSTELSDNVFVLFGAALNNFVYAFVHSTSIAVTHVCGIQSIELTTASSLNHKLSLFTKAKEHLGFVCTSLDH